MIDFELLNAKSLDTLPAMLSKKWDETPLLAGGTDLLDMLKERLIRPRQVVNLKTIPGLSFIKKSGAGLEIGALTTIAEIAEHPLVQKDLAVLAEAATSIATPQLRNMGTIGGNLCQRPRCWYFRNKDIVCSKKGGSKCFAAEGMNKYHCIFGGGPSYIVHPSDAAPALLALGASVQIVGVAGRRTESLEEFFELPIDNLRRENILQPNEVITAVNVPQPSPGTKSTYVKFREKQSQDFAIASVAAVLHMEGKHCKKASIVLGGVAPIPWRATGTEAELNGQKLGAAVIEKAAVASVAGALPMKQNAFKIHLTRNMVKRALEKLGA